MDKETYLEEIKALEKKRIELKNKYMDECCPYKIGEKVIFDKKPGTIERIVVQFGGDFTYYVRMTKKDGTPSLNVREVYSWVLNKLEKA